MADAYSTITSLEYRGKSGSFPLASVNVSWGINLIPTATLTLLSGFEDQAVAALANAGSISNTGTIYLNGNALLTGYPYGSGLTGQSSPFGSGVRANIALGGIGSILKSKTTAGVMFFEPSTMTKDVEVAGAAETPATKVKNGQPPESLGALMGDVDFSFTQDAVQYLLVMFETIQKVGAIDETFKISNYCYGSAKCKLSYNPNIEDDMVNAVMNHWGGTNMWDAMVGVFDRYFIHIVPRGGKYLVKPNMAWLKAAVDTVAASTILNVNSSTSNAAIMERPDSVGVAITAKNPGDGAASNNEQYFYYPETKGDNTRGKGIIVTPPSWINYVGDLEYEQATNSYQYVKGGTAKKYISPTVAHLLSQMYFGTQRSASMTLGIGVPWDSFKYIEEVGEVLKINIDVPGRTKEVLYGMLSSVTLSVSIGANTGSAQMALDFSHVRTEADNEAYAMDSNPLYGEASASDTSTASSTSASSDTVASSSSDVGVITTATGTLQFTPYGVAPIEVKYKRQAQVENDSLAEIPSRQIQQV